MVIEYHCVSQSESKLYLHFPFEPFSFTHSLELLSQTCEEVKKFTIMQFDFTIGTASSNLHRSLASKFKACNAQGRDIICLCLSLSKHQNVVMVLGLSILNGFSTLSSTVSHTSFYVICSTSFYTDASDAPFQP